MEGRTKISRYLLCGATLLALALAILAGCDSRAPAAAPATQSAPAEAQTGVSLPEASLGFITVEPVSEGAFASGGTVPARLAIQPQALAAVGPPLNGRVVSVLVR